MSARLSPPLYAVTDRQAGLRRWLCACGVWFSWEFDLEKALTWTDRQAAEAAAWAVGASVVTLNAPISGGES